MNCGASAGKARAEREGKALHAGPEKKERVNCGASAGKARAKREGKAFSAGPEISKGELQERALGRREQSERGRERLARALKKSSSKYF